ncbi:MAG: hypothetical protein AAGA65_21910 [Actinomycetota bacterium]
MSTTDEPPGDDQRAVFENTVLDRLRTIFDANPWIVTTEMIQGSANLATIVQALTDQPVLAVGAANGVGRPPENVKTLVLGMEPSDEPTVTMRRGQVLLADPPAEFQATVDRWDPTGSARAIAGTTDVSGVRMGRPTFGARREAWRALEDKLAIEAVWAAAGIPVAPSRQVSVADRDGLLVACRELAGEGGTVVAGDNRSGWHGGGAGTFWAPDEAAVHRLLDAPDALGRFDRVRVMPFLEGVPCSIHGMVVPDGGGDRAVVTFRPCEMLVLRDLATHGFVYSRSATYWDPPAVDRQQMKATAEAIGRELTDQVDFRGVFTVDGVLTNDGFAPTEVNPRYGAALPARHPTIDGQALSLFLLNLAVVEGLLDDLDLRPIGPIATSELDRARRGVAFVHTEVVPQDERRAVVVGDGSGELDVVETTGDPDRHAELARLDGDHPALLVSVEFGSAAASSGLAAVEFLSAPVGPPLGPVLVEVARALDRAWGVGVGDLQAARSVR